MLTQPMHSAPKMEARKWHQNGSQRKDNANIKCQRPLTDHCIIRILMMRSCSLPHETSMEPHRTHQMTQHGPNIRRVIFSLQKPPRNDPTWAQHRPYVRVGNFILDPKARPLQKDNHFGPGGWGSKMGGTGSLGSSWLYETSRCLHCQQEGS